MNGILNLYKPAGMTSHDCVNRIRRIYKTKKVGHTGTLDPMATGVLPILVGNAVKASEYVMNGSKTYRAGILFGIATDTEDITGSVTGRDDFFPNERLFSSVLSEFLGEYMQIPPAYSALKVGGRKMYELARSGESFERTARPVRIYDIRLERQTGDMSYEFIVNCSKGTYIRTLITDIAAKMNTVAVMNSLERIEAKGFLIGDSVTLDELEDVTDDEKLASFLLPTEKIFSEYPEIKLDPFYSRLAKNGLEIYAKKAKIIPEPEAGGYYRMYDESGDFFALGQAGIFDGGLAVKPRKFFL